ncbi:hypothetical protein GX48_01074 [Paracoccidioides brasiliensis]|nr:hypothetical protein GX48_01074 [Paracoccidioides brasiliensis]
MLIEDQRFIHEDLERLEQGISDRVSDEPRNIRDRLNRDHQISGFLNRIQQQSERLLDIYKDVEGLRAKEVQAISTGEPFDEFYKRLDEIKDFHRRYPNEPVENLERAYKRRHPGENEGFGMEVENMFSGEESYGQFFDLTKIHEDYLNLPGVKRLTYLQYLDLFDVFTQPQLPIKRSNKLTDKYFQYVGDLAAYLESFIKRVKPLEPLDKLFNGYDGEFEKLWRENKVPGWEEETTAETISGPKTEGTGEGIWCPDCEREFKNHNVYKNHLSGKKHIRAAEARKADGSSNASTPHPNGDTGGVVAAGRRLKERAIAEREHRVRSLAATLKEERQATRVNVERKQGMTERERQMELDALFAESAEPPEIRHGDSDSDSDSEEKIYNPLKLPLAWDGKPIPYWLYKLHGLGVELPCEICGNFVYMGRRAFDKHFSEARHIYGLRCLGITQQTSLFREITKIEEALRLWEKLEQDRKKEKESRENVVQMEDAEGNVMPERIYLERVSLRNPDLATIESWFSHYAKQIHDGKKDRLALLSCLFPERRPERVFGLKEPTLVKVIGRCHLLGVTRRQELDSYRTCGDGDLGNYVESVMKQAENDIHEESGVTVEEIDNVLNHIASRCRFSGPDLRRQRTAANVDEALSPVFRRLTSREAKWFTRIILKDISPITLPALFVLRNFHFLLPELLLVQDSFGAVLDLLSCDPMRRFPPRPDPQYAKLQVSFAASHIPLTVGIKVGRPMFYKARGVKHCCKMAGRRTMSVERKYDGEYCQIHINLAKRPNCIQIFSKSGRDSTADRSGVHSTLKECLRIGKSGSKISRNCILEGELLVWSDVKSKLLPFHKLRKHVARSGSFIGTKNDYQYVPNLS